MKSPFKSRFLPILLFLLIANDANCFFSTHGLRGIINYVNTASNVMPKNPVQEPITLNITEEEATKELLRKQQHDVVQPIYIRMVQANGTTDKPEVTTEKPTETTTLQSFPFDDPAFIPGQFLDGEGSAKLADVPPVSDLLTDFVGMISGQMTDVWIACIVISGGILFSIFLIALFATTVVLTFSLSQATSRPLKSIKKETSRKPEKPKSQKPAKPNKFAPVEQEYPVEVDEPVEEEELLEDDELFEEDK